MSKTPRVIGLGIRDKEGIHAAIDEATAMSISTSGRTWLQTDYRTSEWSKLEQEKFEQYRDLFNLEDPKERIERMRQMFDTQGERGIDEDRLRSFLKEIDAIIEFEHPWQVRLLLGLTATPALNAEEQLKRDKETRKDNEALDALDAELTGEGQSRPIEGRLQTKSEIERSQSVLSLDDNGGSSESSTKASPPIRDDYSEVDSRPSGDEGVEKPKKLPQSTKDNNKSALAKASGGKKEESSEDDDEKDDQYEWVGGSLVERRMASNQTTKETPKEE